MAVQLTSANRNTIALLVVGTDYNGCTASQKALIDGTGSVPTSTPAGVCGLALAVVQQFSQVFAQAGATSAPDAWEQWFVAEAAWRLAPGVRPDRVDMLERQRVMAMRAAIESYIREGSDASGNLAPGDTLTDIRKYVMSLGVRLDPPKIVAAGDVDAAVQSVLSQVWNGWDWNFKRRQVTASIGTNSGVTWGLSTSESFDRLASEGLYYSDDRGGAIVHADPQQMSRLLAATSTPAGRPEVFRLERRASGTVFHFYPTPDAAYSVRGEVFISEPTAPSSASDSVPFSAFPRSFRPMLRELVGIKVLASYGVPGMQGRESALLARFQDLSTKYDHRGQPLVPGSIGDVYNDFEHLIGRAYP